MKMNSNNKGFTLVEIMIVVVTSSAFLAAMAIPAFLKGSADELAGQQAVLNNARQLSAGADQWYPRERRSPTVTLTDLLGPTSYVKALNSVAKETYPTSFTQGITVTINSVAGVRTITYAP